MRCWLVSRNGLVCVLPVVVVFSVGQSSHSYGLSILRVVETEMRATEGNIYLSNEYCLYEVTGGACQISKVYKGKVQAMQIRQPIKYICIYTQCHHEIKLYSVY